MSERHVESRVAEVQVYARGAVVTRRARIGGLAAETVELVLGGITPLADAGSFRVEASGRAVVALRSSLVVPPAPATPGPALEIVRSLERRLRRLGDERQAAGQQRAALLGLTWDPGFDPRERHFDPARRAADTLAMAGLTGELAAALEPRLVALDDELLAVGRELEAARLAAAQATTRDRAGDGQPTREVRVRLAPGAAAGAATELDLALSYVVGAARWWPTYATRLTDGATRAEVELAAFVAQHSGEDWDGVSLALSTAELFHDARLPELPSLRLSRRQAPAKRGYRPPPPGLDEMFRAHDAARAKLPPPPAAPPPRSAPPLGRATSTTLTGAITGAVSAGVPPQSASRRRQRRESDEVTAVSSPADFAYAREEALASVGGDFDDDEVTGVNMPANEVAASMAPPAPPPRPAPPASAAPMRVSEMAPPAPGGPPAGFGGAPAPRQAARGGGGAAPDATRYAAAAPAALEPADAWLDFDGLSLADGSAGPGQRGRLRRVPEPGAGGPARAQAVAQLEALPPPALVVDPRASRGQYDHRYRAATGADVPSDGRPHRTRLGVAAGAPRARYVTVPREAAEVYREVELDNPFDGPLLAGPCDVYIEGVLLTTTSLGHVGRGGRIAVGLGVEERLRVARNARADEQSAGLLGGSTAVDHRVSIELRSSLGRAVSVEILERVPVTDDDDVEITWSGKPLPRSYDQAERGTPVRGGLCWSVPVEPGGRAQVEWAYKVKLSAKSELVGGNRRE